MFHSVAKVAVKKFDPAGLKDGENILTAFNEFCASFDYAYEAQNRRPPDSEDISPSFHNQQRHIIE